LAVLCPARRSRVLALDAHALVALLQEAGLVHEEHSILVAEVL
jgi:hypothetical protein